MPAPLLVGLFQLVHQFSGDIQGQLPAAEYHPERGVLEWSEARVIRADQRFHLIGDLAEVLAPEQRVLDRRLQPDRAGLAPRLGEIADDQVLRGKGPGARAVRTAVAEAPHFRTGRTF